MSNVCARIGRGQMTVLDSHIAHHRPVQRTRWVAKEVPGSDTAANATGGRAGVSERIL